MKADELQAALGITPAKLREWIKAGLPCERKGRTRVFDVGAVEQWLLSTGRVREETAPPAGVIARTVAEAAKLLDVSKRVFSDWMTEASFPGKPGSPGRRDGYFPIAEIETWRASRFGTDGRSGPQDDIERLVRREMLEMDRDRKLVELERDLGALVDIEETTNFVTFILATAKGILQELPERLCSRLPSKCPPKLKKLNRKVAAEVVREALEQFAELLKGDTDSKEDAE